MGATAAIIGGASLVGGLGGAAISSSGAQGAAQTQANAASGSTALQASIYQQNLARLAPFLGMGNSLLGQFLGMPSTSMSSSPYGSLYPGAPGATAPTAPGGYSSANTNLTQLLGGSLNPSNGMNSSALQDIARAMSQGAVITPQQWAQAGLPPGGGIVGQQLMAAIGGPGATANGYSPPQVPLSSANPTIDPSLSGSGTGSSIPTLSSLTQPINPFPNQFQPPNAIPPQFSSVNSTPPGFNPINPTPPAFQPNNLLAPQFQGQNPNAPQFSSPYTNVPGFTPFQPTEAQLTQTPGYQFTLQQGLNAVNNANSAMGWGLSGAGLKNIAQYATGLADQTYQQQYGNYMQNYATQLGANQAGFGNTNTAFGNNLNSFQSTFGNNLANYNALLGGSQAGFQNSVNAYAPTLAGFQAGFGNYNTNYQNQLQNSQLGFQNNLQAYSPTLAGFQAGFGNQLQNYTTGLSGFQAGFGNYLGQNNQLYNMAFQPIELSTNAALGVGTQGVNSGANIGSSMIGAGNALAAGQLGSANAYGGFLGSAPTNALLNYALYNNMFGGSGNGSVPGYVSVTPNQLTGA